MKEWTFKKQGSRTFIHLTMFWSFYHGVFWNNIVVLYTNLNSTKKFLHVIKQLIVFMGGWKLFTFIFCQIDITLAHLSSAYSLSLQERKSSFPSIFINGCQGYVSGALLRDNFFKIKILFIQKLFNFNKICWQSP